MDIKKLRELRKKATPGLLRVVGRDSWRLAGFPQVEFNTPDQKYFTVHCEADAEYLAAAWNILPEALDEIERLRKENQRLQILIVAHHNTSKMDKLKNGCLCLVCKEEGRV